MVNTLRRVGGWFDRQPYLLLSFTSFFWAGNVVLGRFAAGHVPPVALSVIRWAGACLIVLPFAWPHLKGDWPEIRRRFGFMTVLTLCGISAYNTMAYYGLQYTEAINGLLIQSINPFMIALWSLILLRERLAFNQAIGITCSLAGVLVILCRGDVAILTGVGFNRGDVWILAAVAIFALYSTLAKRRPKIHALSFLAFTTGWGAILLLPVLAHEISTGYTLTFDTVTFATLGYVVLFPSAISYLFFNRGIELVGPNRAAPFMHLIPVFGSALAILFLGEMPQLYHAVGYGLVLTGIFVATRR